MTKNAKAPAGDRRKKRGVDGTLSSRFHSTTDTSAMQYRGPGYRQRWREKVKRQVRPRRRGIVGNE